MFGFSCSDEPVSTTPADEPRPVEAGARSADGAEDGPPPIQFRLTSLLTFITVVAVMFAAVIRLGAVWGTALAWGALLVGAHVAATAWGTRAGARTSRPRTDHAAGAPGDAAARNAVEPTTRLGNNHRLGFSMFLIVGFGAVTGAVVGTTLVWTHRAGGLGPSAAVVACSASAVIGGFLCFLAGSCIQVFARAWHEAARHAGKSQRPHSRHG